MMQGRIDVVRPDGLIEGWCWDEDLPESRLNVSVLVDGIEAGSGLAALYREDLRLAKIGDGCHAFSFVTQTLPSSDKRTQNYTLIESETRRPIGAPLVVQNKEAVGFDNRLLELETRNRLLAARLEELTRRDAETSSAELFSVVGEFFTRLSKDLLRGEPLGIERRLDDIVESAARKHPPLVFPHVHQPAMTIVVEACVSLTQTHACLTALLRAGAGSMARIVVIDGGQAPDTVLLPGLVRGIRYLRTVTALSSEWAEVEQADDAELLVMLSGVALVSESCLREIAEAFICNANAAAIGAHAESSGAEFARGGLCLLEGTLRDCAEIRHLPAAVDVAACYPAHALSHQAAAFRRSALRAVGGFDPLYEDDLGAAVIDLCFRLRQRGWAVVATPFATVEWQPAYGVESWITRGLAGSSRIADLLRARWLDASLPHPPLYTGHAAVVGFPQAFEEELFAVHRLRAWGYSVDYLATRDLPLKQANDLRRAGARLMMTEDVGHALGGCAATLVYATVAASMLEFRPIGSRLVIGLAALEQSRPVEIQKFLDDPSVRQVAGL